MAVNLGTLGEFFPDKDIRCRVRGCNNTWNFSGEKALRDVAAGKSGRPDRMCDECYQRFLTLADRQAPCTTPACDGTWTWTPFQQLEALARGHDSPPRGFCDTCRRHLDSIQDRSVPCRMKGCSGTWVWTRQQQIVSEDDTCPSRLCHDCVQKLRKLTDQDIACRVRHCTNTWRWNRYWQLEWLVGGNDIAEPPRRMCERCFNGLRTLKDAEVECSVPGCTRTWPFGAHAQLEYLVEHGGDAPTPQRMCQRCFRFHSGTVDRTVPCSNRGCSGSWTHTRDMQVQDWLRRERRVPHRMCTDCAQKVESLPDRDVPCMVTGCPGTWAYTALDQVKDACLKKDQPSRRCRSCERFLADAKPKAVPCESCGKEITWTAYEQLLCSLGTFERPARCVDCAEQNFALSREDDKERPRTHHHVVRMPAHGPWQADPMLADWPKHLTYDVIDRIEAADVRIVALGYELTYSAEDPAEHWPHLLQEALNRRLDGKATVAVANAGIPRTTSRQALARLGRDVRPFSPHLTIFSFAFADSFLRLNRRSAEWRPLIEAAEAVEALDELCRRLRDMGGSLLYWTSNPAFPHDLVGEELGDRFVPWANAQESSKRHCLIHAARTCTEQAIPVLDLRSRFEVNGRRSAVKWMSNWYQHNETGARNIATWIANYVLQEKLIPLPTEE